MIVPDRMRAAYVEALGPADSILVGDLPVPKPGPTDALVEVEATVVNPVDTLVRSGRFATRTPFPFVIGRDLVGTVAAAGEGAGFAAGDRVWCNSLGHDGRQGAFAQYALVSADRLYRLPDGVDATTTVAVAHPAVTAYLAWFEHARVRAGETVYVGGAAGNVGRAALTMAKHAGARVVASAGPADRDRCLAAGADVVVDYHDADVAGALRAAAPDGVDIFWDTSGRQSLARALETVSTGGRVLVTAAGSGDQHLPIVPFYTRDISLLGFVISRASASSFAGAARTINALLRDGLLDATLADDLPLSAAPQAHARMESGSVRGRLIVRP